MRVTVMTCAGGWKVKVVARGVPVGQEYVALAWIPRASTVSASWVAAEPVTVAFNVGVPYAGP